MVRRKLMGLLVCTLVVSLASFASAGIPDMSTSSMATAAGAQVSMFSLPDGSGDGFDDVYLIGGAKTNATVTVTLLDSGYAPIFNYPNEDVWVESNDSGLCLCAGGSAADANTDVNGQTTFTNAMFAGGCGVGLIISVNGDYLNQSPLDFLFNSADTNCDFVVNLADVVFFAGVYYGAYDYCADFYWDGNVNLSDIVRLAQGMGATCP